MPPSSPDGYTIITLIDSELPANERGEKLEFPKEEIIVLLHDEGPEGRLFHFDSW